MSTFDRKLVGFAMPIVAFALVSVFAVAQMRAKAPPVQPNAALAADSAQGFLRTTEPALIAQIEARARQELEAGALKAPQERRAANVLLRRGLTGSGVQLLLEPHAFTLTGIEAKCPVKPPGSPFTTFTGLREVAGTPGSIEQKVDRIIGGQRLLFEQQAQQLAKSPGMEPAAAQAREVATSREFAVYRVEVLGTREALLALSKESFVRLVVVDEHSDVATLDAARLEYEQLGPPTYPSVPLE
jgi:hypothetical protein